MPFHLPRLTTLNRSSIHRGGSGVEEIFPSDEIHNWFISARETKACWKTIFGIIELPYTFFFPFPFFSRRFFIAIFPFLFVLFFFFSFFISRSPLCEAKCRAHASNARFFAEIEIGNTARFTRNRRAYTMVHGFYEPFVGIDDGSSLVRVKLAARKRQF